MTPGLYPSPGLFPSPSLFPGEGPEGEDMSERSGIAAQLGVATEETFGTYKAPSRFFPFESESLTLTKEYIRSKGLRAGQLVQRHESHLAPTRSVGCDVQMEFFNEGMGILGNQLHGEVVT